MNRREFLQVMAAAYLAGFTNKLSAKNITNYNHPFSSDIRLLHITDTHAQLSPSFFREPNINLGTGSNRNVPPHIVGDNFLKYYGLDGSFNKYLYSYINFNELAKKYGKFGGYAHLKTAIDHLRNESNGNSLLLDGGDTWQGSAVSLFESGRDMVEASNILGVDVMTGHWEFTFGEDQFIKNIKNFNGEFVANNVFLNDEAIFNDVPSYDDENHYQKPYTIKEVNGKQIAIIGQAFPYTPIANPSRYVSNLTFGIREQELQETVDKVKDKYKPALVVVLSHNGIDVDKKLASRVNGIDIIFGGHTHDAVPKPIIIKNNNGKTLVTNSGCNGKFLSFIDIKFSGKSYTYNYNLLPILSNEVKPNQQMQSFIDSVSNPYKKLLSETIGYADDTLYRRSNFNGTFDDLLCDSMNTVLDSEISLSPGFRWGPSLTPNQPITMSDIYNHTAITYPNTYVRSMTGETIKNVLEDVADNIFNIDPYLQQGGDMVRTRGIKYTINPRNKINTRIEKLRLNNNIEIKPDKEYKVSGWASVNNIEEGKPIWDITKEYLKAVGTYKVDQSQKIKIINEDGNIGIET
ncbi:thiosulfohydrolase SoxB [Gammaproteobacteria bacterium]|nr:thiosulfohydrolase SoxB [Gammaproteobacteria bacterium]